MSLNISVNTEELVVAYRKAKVDLFYSSRACRLEIADFEKNLNANIKKIKADLDAGRAPSIEQDNWTLQPKSIKPAEGVELPLNNLISSDPSQEWKRLTADGNQPRVELRLMEKLPIAFHVFATLWLMKVGHKFDAKLSDAARGNRLRRRRPSDDGTLGDINSLSLGSIEPYLHPYRKWRDDAFDAMELALDEGKAVVTLTADVTSFYHKLDARFMLHNDFVNTLDVELSDDEQSLHQLFINAVVAWADQTPLQRGLPVGLAASSVIANVALFEFDLLMQERAVPLYYGRYVDDVIVVMENTMEISSSKGCWQWFINCFGGESRALQWTEEQESLFYNQSYLDGSEVSFSGDKNKVFILNEAHGRSVLASIRHAVQAQSSEWRSLPELPSTKTGIQSLLISTIQKNGIAADSLRKADTVSVRRAGFALKLRDIEAYSRALPASEWKQQRHDFLDIFIQQVLVLPIFFDFFTYLPRVMSLVVSCADFSHLKQICDAYRSILSLLVKGPVHVNAAPETYLSDRKVLVDKVEKNLLNILVDAVAGSMPHSLTATQKAEWDDAFGEYDLFVEEHQSCCKDLIARDLAYRPLKQSFLPDALFVKGTQHRLQQKEFYNLEAGELEFNSAVEDGAAIVADLAGYDVSEKGSSGMLFPTRPLGIADLYHFHPDPFSFTGRQKIQSVLLAMRGFPALELPKRQAGSISIMQAKSPRSKVRVAVASWKTQDSSWRASICKTTDPDQSRLSRLTRLVNQVMKCSNKPDYLIFPECSIPTTWFMALAAKLQRQGISLIAGVEYIHSSDETVKNQVWAALSHDALGFPSTMIYCQSKQRPALSEERLLESIAGLRLDSAPCWKKQRPPLINHGGFQFGMLLCSELTNISYRTALRGKVDALFVPEWNRDTESFNALVESAALDMHAYIVQCNDREYGDSRIRAPFKDSWKRDLVRVKGGSEDYFVIGDMDILALRAFQSHHRSPSKPFKPVPDGFEIAAARRVLPT